MNMGRKKTMNLYFGDWVMTTTTIMLVGLIVLIVYMFVNRSGIHYWGRRTMFLAAYGLLICCFAAARDGLDKTIQAAIDGSGTPGIFSLVSFPTIIGCVGAAIIVIAGIATLFVKKQDVREILCFVMSGGILLKIFTIEVSRIFL